jgi:TolB-like protein
VSADTLEAGAIRADPLTVAAADSTGTRLVSGLIEALAARLGPEVRLLATPDTSGARWRLRGTATGTGADVRISLRLTPVDDQKVVWAEDYYFPAGDVETIRAAAVARIARALTARLKAANRGEPGS